MQYNPKKVYPLPKVFTPLRYPPSQKQEKPAGPSPWIFKPCVDYIDIIGLLSVIFFSKLLTTLNKVCLVEDKTAFASQNAILGEKAKYVKKYIHFHFHCSAISGSVLLLNILFSQNATRLVFVCVMHNPFIYLTSIFLTCA